MPSSWVLNFPYYYFFPSGCASLTWLGTPPSRPLSSTSPSSLLPPLPRLLPLGACCPFPPYLLFSLSTARPTHIRSPVVFLPAWCPRYSTLFLVVSRFLHLLTSRLLMASPPRPPFFRLSLFQVGFFFLMVPGWVWVSRLLLGLPLPWLTRRLCVCCSLSLSCSCSYLRLASPPPPFSIWRLLRFSVTLLCVGNASSYVPSFLISSVLLVRLACGRLFPSCLSSWGVLPCPVGGLDGLLGHLMCCVSLVTGFSSLWYCSLPPPCHGSFMCLACQAQVSSSHFTFLGFVSES